MRNKFVKRYPKGGKHNHKNRGRLGQGYQLKLIADLLVHESTEITNDLLVATVDGQFADPFSHPDPDRSRATGTARAREAVGGSGYPLIS